MRVAIVIRNRTSIQIDIDGTISIYLFIVQAIYEVKRTDVHLKISPIIHSGSASANPVDVSESLPTRDQFMISLYSTTTSSSFLSPHRGSLYPSLPYTSPLQPMVSTKERKRGKVSVGIRQGIPFNRNEVVMRTKVTRKFKNRVFTEATKVVVPIAPSAPSEPSDPHLQPPSDQDPPPIPPKPTRKGPSRSVSVSLFPPPFFFAS